MLIACCRCSIRGAARDGYAWIGDILFGLEQDRYNDAQVQIREYRDELIDPNSTQVKVGNVDTRKLQIEVMIRKLPVIKTSSSTTAKETSGELFFFIGDAQFYLKRVDLAVASWEACAKSSPEFGSVFKNLASAYLMLNQPQHAMKSSSVPNNSGSGSIRTFAATSKRRSPRQKGKFAGRQ